VVGFADFPLQAIFAACEGAGRVMRGVLSEPGPNLVFPGPEYDSACKALGAWLEASPGRTKGPGTMGKRREAQT
jgi:hypothetical protein